MAKSSGAVSRLKKFLSKFHETDEQRQERLKIFQEYLEHVNPDHKCFLCEQIIEEESPYLHHVIPNCYVNKDDLWNLVYTHEDCHREWNDRIPDEETLRRLEKRNIRLLRAMLDNKVMDQYVDELGYAVKYKLVRQEIRKITGGFGNV